jgi:hypothetical protein
VRRFALLTIALAACSSEDTTAAPVTPPKDSGSVVADAAIADTAAADSVADSAVTEVAADASGDVLADGDAMSGSSIGAPMPTWQLVDFQPKSAKFNQTYGLEAFKGKVTVVTLLLAS